MIKFNNSDIIDWNFDDNDIIKVHHNCAVVFYKFDSEQWSGDFYWVYMAQANITDEQVQQVIDYNENL
jgi:hypothetical protein